MSGSTRNGGRAAGGSFKGPTGAGHPPSPPPGSPARTHSMMSLSVRPQRRLLSARVSRSQSFAGVLGSHERGPRYAEEGC